MTIIEIALSNAPMTTSHAVTRSLLTRLSFAPLASLAAAAVLSLAACSSSQPPGDSAQAASAEAAAAAPGPTTAAGADAAWLKQRVKYMDCVQERAKANLAAKGTSKDVAASAIDACKSQLSTMHDAFQDYLSAQMSSSHGKASARQAADRVTNDTREKARSYLTQYVERQRYEAGQR
ncbi:hypothetical protein CUPL110328_06735 [Cupriavidus plantarum]|nr:hypothetical protein LMG26296_03025 [Cupriavidus plantarum]SMR65321.1 hypothetical protein SAMN05421735_0167 [Cupriavidus plantarum]